jgi:hypothetical protein
MAHCVISAVYDTDVDQMMPACVVHAAYAPCPRDGESASTAPLHSDDGRCGRREAVRFWEQRTHRQRTLVLHHGSLGDDRGHAVGAEDLTCWCGPELLPASGDVYPLAVQCEDVDVESDDEAAECTACLSGDMSMEHE